MILGEPIFRWFWIQVKRKAKKEERDHLKGFTPEGRKAQFEEDQEMTEEDPRVVVDLIFLQADLLMIAARNSEGNFRSFLEHFFQERYY